MHDRLSVLIDGDTNVVTITGEIDAATAPRLQEAIDKHATDTAALDLDLSGVTFIDSLGIRVLVHANEIAQQADGRLHLTKASDVVRRALTYAGLIDHLSIATDA